MSVAPSQTAVLLARIASALNVRVAVFAARDPVQAADTVSAADIAALVFDADGRRFASAFARLSPHARRSLADIATALVSDEKGPSA